MNSKQVLDKIAKMLYLNKEDEILLTYAKLADGTIVESPTFDVGETLDVVTEEGKTPAPDGEHELALKDTEGNETYIKVFTKDGKIVERENVELEIVDAKPIPQTGTPNKAEVVPDAEGTITSGTVKAAEELPSGDGVSEDVADLPENPQTTDKGDEPLDMKKMYEEMAYRIEEMEKKITQMEEAMTPKEEDDVEPTLPKLDGAPVEETKMSAVSAKKKENGMKNYQDTFFSKLYK
jgi:hypothetical protein